jgi:hypothetical protein
METEQARNAPSSEPQTADPRQAYIRSARRRIWQGVFLALVTLITIFSLCVAWFMNNAQVSANAMQLQSSTFGNFELATAGQSSGFFADFLNKLLPGASSAETWASGDLQGTRTSSGASEILWQMGTSSNLANLNAGSGLEPGMRGYLTFYVIPSQSGDLHLQCSLDELLYENDESGAPVAISDAAKAETLDALMAKHLLFFLLEPVDAAADTGNASAPPDSALADSTEVQSDTSAGASTYTATWIQNGTFTLDFFDAKANEPQEVTLYWVWPYLFGQLLVEDSATLLNQPAILNRAQITNASALYEALRSDILSTAADAPSAADADPDADPDSSSNSSGSIDFLTGYFYASDGDFSLVLSDTADGQTTALNAILESISKGNAAALASSEYTSMNEAYNDADQYIGENLRYLAVRLTAVAN